eukprot:Amastigsp_a521538_31.p2 type:complete len:141 gc:universal Amastigsp_a521538_31:1190-768(-)
MAHLCPRIETGRRAVADRIEVRVAQNLRGGDPVHVVVTQHLPEKIQRLGACEVRTLGRNKRRPRSRLGAPDFLSHIGREFDLVLVEIGHKVVRPEELDDRGHLVRVRVPPPKQRMLEQNHTPEHASQRPDVHRVVVVLVV